jgi:hypothetical protein
MIGAKAVTNITDRNKPTIIAPPSFWDWPRVKKELRIDSMSMAIDKVKVTYDAVYKSIMEHKKIEDMGIDDLTGIAILARMLRKKEDVDVLLETQRNGLEHIIGEDPDLWKYSFCGDILCLITQGMKEQVRQHLKGSYIARSWDAGLTAWLLGETAILKYIEKKAEYKSGDILDYEIRGIFDYINGDGESARKMLENVREVYEWRDGLAVKGDGTSIPRSIWSAIFMALLAGYDMNLTPRG